MGDTDGDEVACSLEFADQGVDIGRGVGRRGAVVVDNEDMHDCWRTKGLDLGRWDGGRGGTNPEERNKV